MGKETTNCLGCSKKFSKNEFCVQCTVCGLWIHKVCADISDDVFNFLDKMKKETGATYWACKPCTKYAQGMNHRMREIEEDLKEVKQSTKQNKEAITTIEKKVEELAEEVKRTEGVSKKDIEEMMRAERDEARERKDRELNVILHGAEECGDSIQEGSERIAWDRAECLKLFNRNNLRLRQEDIKFCRRVGPKGDRARPLVIGFYSMASRNAALKMDLRAASPDLAVGPDLTKKQREEEAQIWKEMEEKNEKRTEEEKAKNLVWKIVGPKGDRRLIRGMGAGTGANIEPLRQPARRGWPGGRGGTSRRTGPLPAATTIGPVQLLETSRDDQPFRPRLTSKRGREETQEEEEMDEEDGTQQPPTKH
jgi:Mg2+ and Co2+ transporter CorA